MECRSGCAACCIAPSINLPLPNMPNGKPAGVPCANLDMVSLTCRIWGQENYPALCERFKAEEAICGTTREEAINIIEHMETLTQP